MTYLKKYLILLIISALSVLNLVAQPAKHVIIITIDGFRPEFYQDASWNMVNLRQMMQAGVYAKGVNSIFPSVTFPNHTTIITGVKSVKHGIYYNAPFGAAGENGEWYWYAKDIKSPTLWDAAKKSGLISASVNYPVSAGAPVNYNIPIIKKKGLKQLDVIRQNSTPEGFFAEAEVNATGKLYEEDFTVEDDNIGMDANVARIAGYIIRKYKPGLITLRLSSVDHYEHEQGREGDKVRVAVAGADQAIRTILESVNKAGLKESTAIIVTGDHGFVNRKTTISPNVWLAAAGLITSENEWKAQFYGAGGSAWLMLKDPKDKVSLTKVMSVLNSLPEAKKNQFKIIDRAVLDKMGSDPNAAMALAAIPGVAFSSAIKGAESKAVSGGTHGYFPDFADIQTGFVGYGAGFQRGKMIPVMGLEDIAPMAAKLLGLDFNGVDGVLHTELLSND